MARVFGLWLFALSVLIGVCATAEVERNAPPEEVESVLAAADAQMQAGSADDALQLLLETQSEYPQSVELAAAVATTAAALGDRELAAEFYREAGRLALEQADDQGAGNTELITEIAAVLDALGHVDAALQLLEATCGSETATIGQTDPQSAGCLSVLAGILRRDGDLERAESLYRDVLEWQLSALGGEADATLRTRAALAELTRLQGGPDAALAELLHIKEAVTAYLPDDVLLLTEVRGLEARAHEDLGQFGEALALNEEAFEFWRARAGDAAPETLAALNFLGATYLRLGRLSEAEAAFEEALTGLQRIYGNRHRETLAVMNNLGVVLEKQGLYDRAEPVLRRALQISETLLGTGHPITLRNMANLALLLESQGNFDRAEPLYLLPIEVLSRELGEAHPDTVAIMNNLAFLYSVSERYSEAAELFERVYDSWQVSLGADHQNTLKAMNNLARSYHRLERLTEAESLLLEALDRRRSALGERHLDTLRSMHDLADVYASQARFGEAETLLRATLDLDEAVLGPQHPYTFETLNTLARVLQARGKLDQAFEQQREGFARRTEFLDRMLWVTSANAREGYIRLHRSELDQWVRLLTAFDPEVSGRELIDVALQRKGLLLRISAEIQQIADLGLDPELTELAAALTEAREALAARTLAGPRDQSGDEHLAAIGDLEDRVAELEAEIGRASALYRQAVTAVRVEDLIEHIPAGGTLVDFLVFEGESGPELIAGVLAREGDVVRFSAVRYPSYGDVTQAVRTYREIIQDEGAADADVLEVGQDMYALLWAPLDKIFTAGGPVYVVPDGLLNILPFDAMADAEGRYLIETTDLHVLSSSRDLLPSVVPAAVGRVLIVAGPNYDTEDVAGTEVLAEIRGRRALRAAIIADAPAQEPLTAMSSAPNSRRARLRDISIEEIDSRGNAIKASLRAGAQGLRGMRFTPLPWAEREGRLIFEEAEEAQLDRALFVRKEAQERVLSEIVEAPWVLHLATHGYFLEPRDELRRRLLKLQRGAEVGEPPPGDNPLLRAGLAFAGVNSNAPFLGDLDTSNDGVLTALEVLGLNLGGTQLVVLSACETGLGEIHEGEGVYGLRRAFKEAGVQEIVMSLWAVSDAGTQALMSAMYERLLAGVPARDALRGAQRDLMGDPRWGYPYVWAAFTIVGK